MEQYKLITHTRVKILSKERAAFLDELQNMTGREIYDKYGYKRDETITETITFDDNSDLDICLTMPLYDTDTPNISAVLYAENGNVLGENEDIDDLFDEWTVYVEGNTNAISNYIIPNHIYTATLKSEELYENDGDYITDNIYVHKSTIALTAEQTNCIERPQEKKDYLLRKTVSFNDGRRMEIMFSIDGEHMRPQIEATLFGNCGILATHKDCGFIDTITIDIDDGSMASVYIVDIKTETNETQTDYKPAANTDADDIIGNDKSSDNVNHPVHYQGKHECIDEMIALFGIDAVKAFCKCNVYKYRYRADRKNGQEDIAKAEWYMDKLMELEKK